MRWTLLPHDSGGAEFDSLDRPSARVGFVDWPTIDAGPGLRSGESISGTPTVVPDAASGLEASDVTVDGNVIQFKLDGGAGVPRYEPWHITVTMGVSPGSQSRKLCLPFRTKPNC